MHLIESAPFNKGKSKIYSGVPGNLVAFACKLSFQRGHEGNIAFNSAHTWTSDEGVPLVYNTPRNWDHWLN